MSFRLAAFLVCDEFECHASVPVDVRIENTSGLRIVPVSRPDGWTRDPLGGWRCSEHARTDLFLAGKPFLEKP